MEPRRIENATKRSSRSSSKERRYINDIMMSYGIFENEKTDITPDVFNTSNGSEISTLNIA